MFRMHPNQRSVILIAFSGRYWTWRIVQREDVIHLAETTAHSDFEPDEEDGENDEDEKDDEDAYGQETGEDVEFTDDKSLEEPDSQAEDGSAQSGQNNSRADFLEPVMAEANLILPTTDWTNLLRLETSASNQQFYLIHAHLRNVVQDNTGHMG